MESRWWIIFLPLSLPIAAAAAGGMASFFTLARYRPTDVRRGQLLVVLVGLSVAAAWVPNAGQQLYDVGMSFPEIETLQGASYFQLRLHSVRRMEIPRKVLVAVTPCSSGFRLFCAAIALDLGIHQLDRSGVCSVKKLLSNPAVKGTLRDKAAQRPLP